MKDKVERLAKGVFEYEQPELLLSEEMLSISVSAGETFCGKISVYNREMTIMKGVLYSSCELLVLNETKFVGIENEVTYTVHAEYAKAGEIYKGNITIVSECGEVKLPFVIRITPVSCMSSVGEIRDLFQFASLAQSDWYEARKVFLSDRFEKAVLGDREGEQTIYRQLRNSPSPDRAMEEFLVHSRKKNPVQIRVDRTALKFVRLGDKAVMEHITLWKDTWGYTDVTVETEGEFFLVSARRILSENFNANRYILEVAVDGATLAEGNYFGRIFLKTPRQCIKIDITCSCERTARENEKKRHAFQMSEMKLSERYFDFRLGKIKSGSYIAEAESIVELLLVRLQEEIFPEPVRRRKERMYKMYRAYLALIGGKEKFADDEITQIRMEFERGNPDAELLGGLNYLEAMRQKSAAEVRGFAAQIRNLSERYTESAMLLWFRLYTDRRSEGGRSANLAEIEERYEKGCRSPLLYYEAAVIWNEEPSLLKELDAFELQVLFFALKKGMLQKEVVLQLSLLALQEKRQEPLLRRCLCLAYRQYGQRDTLQALCTLLIAAGVREKKYHGYFAEACASQLRIPNLQEYYIYTCECTEQTQIDQSVLLYFIYGNELEEPYCAYLYAYVVRNKDTMSSFYRTYLKRIEQYAVNSMKSGRIDKNLAIIYAEVLRGSLLDAELAAVLPELLFSYYVECDNKEMTAVSVLHKEEEKEKIVPLVSGAAVVHIYTEDAKLLLLDARGNRYFPTSDCRIFRLLHEEDLLARCYELAGENRILLLNLLEKVYNYRTVDTDSVELSKRVARVDGLLEEFRQREIHFLIRYCYDNFQGELMDGYLAKINLDYLNKEERNQMIELLIVRGRYDLALDAVSKYGMEGIAAKRILKLCERMLLQCGEGQNDMLLLLCRQVFFEGRYNENVVRYLVWYFSGTTAEMYQVWQAAEELSVGAEVLEERLLAQILFAESYVPEAYKVFLSYSRKKGNPKLIRAYLSYMAYRYFLKDCELPEALSDLIRQEADEDNIICRLAVLKEYAAREALTDAQVQYADYSMRLLTEQGMVFPFFAEFEGRVPLPPCMSDKIYVEYRTNPKRRVMISYLYDDTNAEDKFVREEMKHVGYGVFTKDFTLFYGEELQYYITEEQEAEQAITESFYCKIDAAKVHDETTKYGQINLILTAQDMQDEKTTIDMLENYYRMEYTVNRLFAPIKE
ncbi:MAG: hypothetical protein J1E35_08560 [Lachnospiraceae bacterium]|nr:hypothetical protein [Lachnospiraceae bacterium]